MQWMVQQDAPAPVQVQQREPVARWLQQKQATFGVLQPEMMLEPCGHGGHRVFPGITMLDGHVRGDFLESHPIHRAVQIAEQHGVAQHRLQIHSLPRRSRGEFLNYGVGQRTPMLGAHHRGLPPAGVGGRNRRRRSKRLERGDLDLEIASGHA